MNKNLAVSVLVFKNGYAGNQVYTYLVPEKLKCKIKLGKNVVVPFGKYNSKNLGIILSLEENTQHKGILKNIYAVLDDAPLISLEMINILKWIKSTCFSTYIDALNLVIPKELKSKIEDIVYILNLEKDDLSQEEKSFLKKFEGKNNFSLREIKKLKIKNHLKILDSLLSKGVVKEKIEIVSGIKKKKSNLLKINPEVELESFSFTKKQQLVLNFLKSYKIISSKEIINALKIGNSVVKNLIEKQVLIKVENTSKNLINLENKKINLTPTQNEILKKLLNLYNKREFNVSLLHGVTGSGKTYVILQLIDEVLKSGKSVIFLVPEIALTQQFIKLFTSKYGNKVAVIHSGISKSEKVQTWEKIKNGEIEIVVGARSAVFAPFENLGLIVVDEEHEFTYKSENTPRFDARQVAMYRCNFNKCMMIFSSATPSFESYYMAKNGKYNLLELKERYKNFNLPEVKIVDMNNRFNVEGNILFSDELLEEIKKTLENKKQAIIFLNRRGFNTFVKCRNCGEVQMCPYCSVSLNYHKSENKLLCHYCGFTRSFLEKCINCKEEKLSYLGFGTQRAEFQLSELVPEAKILRVDSDSTLKDKQNTIKEFEKGNYNVLIGTQMISKGFNFPNVNLVGILMADQYLYSGDFRGYEKTFSLITQTIGRAGRTGKKSKAIIQTFSPENNVLKLAAEQNYEKFFEEEISVRRLMLLPPFVDICLIAFKSKSKELAFKFSKIFFEKLVFLAKEKYNDLPLRIFSPSCANIEKMANHYRYKIIIKCKAVKKFRQLINDAILEFKLNPLTRKVSIVVDMNPKSIL